MRERGGMNHPNPCPFTSQFQLIAMGALTKPECIISMLHLRCFLSLFQLLHAHYVLLILHELRRALKCLPNVNRVSTYQSTCVTVVGDLHGSLPDLMLIFHKVEARVYASL